VRVTIQKHGVPEFTEKYTIQELPLEERSRTSLLLEQRVYQMTNRLIENILRDEKFRKIIAGS
jgi:hypothetical protein